MWCNCKKPAKPYPSTPSISAPDVDSLDLNLNTQDDVTFTYTPADVQINVSISSSDLNVAQTYPLVFGDWNARFTVVWAWVWDATITITNNDNPEQTYTVSVTVTDVTPPYYTNNSILVNVETPWEATPTRKTRGKAKVEATGDIYRAKVFAADWDSPDYVWLTWGEWDTPAVSYLGDADNEYCRALFASVDVTNSIARSVEDIHNAWLLENGVAKFEDESWSALQTFFADPLTEESVEAVDEVIENNPPARFSAPKWNTDLSPSSVQKFDHVSLFLMMPENGWTISAEPYGGITIQSQYQHEWEWYNYIVYWFITWAWTVSLRCTSSDWFVDDLIIESADAVSVEALDTLPASISVEVGETTEVYFGYTPSNAENVENQIILTSFNCSAVITAASGWTATLSVTWLEAGDGSVTLVVYGWDTYNISVNVTQPAPIYLSNEVAVYGLSVEEVEWTNYYSYAIDLFSRWDYNVDWEFIYVQVSWASENEYLSGVASFEVSPTFPSQEWATTIAHQLQWLTVKQFYDIFLSDLGTSVGAQCQWIMYSDMVLAADEVYKNPSDTTPFDTQLTAYLNARECAVQYPIEEIFYVHHLGDTITISYIGYEDVVSVADVIWLAWLQIWFNNIDKYKLVQIDWISNEIWWNPIETVTIHEWTQDLYILGKELIITSNTDAPTGWNITADGEWWFYITFPQDNSDTWDVYFDIFNLYTGVKIDWYLWFYGWVLHYSNGEYDFTERTFELDNGDDIWDMLTPLLNKLDWLIYTQIDLATINAILSDNAMTLYDSVYLLKWLDYWLLSYDSHDIYKSLEFKRSSQTRRFNAGEGKNPIYWANKWRPVNNNGRYVEFKSDWEWGYMFRIRSGDWVSLSLTQDEKTYLDSIFSSQQSTEIVTQSFQDNMLVQFYTTWHTRVDDFVDFYGIDFYTWTWWWWATYVWFNWNRYYLNVQEDWQWWVVAYATPSWAENVKNWIVACAEAIDLATYQAWDMSALNTELRNRLINYVPNPVQTIGSPSENSVEIIMWEANPQITFSYTPTDANEFDDISVVSDDEGVATVSNVSNDGNWTASFTIEQVAAGTCTVTYSLTSDPTQTYDIGVEVTALTPATLTSVDTTPLTIDDEGMVEVQFTYTPTDANDFSGITVTSTDEGIASGEVAEELSSEWDWVLDIFWEGEWHATITVSDWTNTYQIPVTSQWTHVSTIWQPSQNSITLTEGAEDTSISFSYSPSDAYSIESDINVSSSDENVATVEIDDFSAWNGVLRISAGIPWPATLTYELADDPTQTYNISVTVTAAWTPVETTSFPSANALSIAPWTYWDVYMSYRPTNCTVQDMNDTITIFNPSGFSSEYVWNQWDGEVSTFRITASDDWNLYAGWLTYQATQDPYAKTIYVESWPSEALVSLTAPSTTHYTVINWQWTSFDFLVGPSNAFPVVSELTMTCDKCYPYFATRDTSTWAITVWYTPDWNSGENGFITISMTNDPTQTFTVTFDIV